MTIEEATTLPVGTRLTWRHTGENWGPSYNVDVQFVRVTAKRIVVTDRRQEYAVKPDSLHVRRPDCSGPFRPCKRESMPGESTCMVCGQALVRQERAAIRGWNK